MKASIIIRTYNEEKHLGELLNSIKNQDTSAVRHETIIVDSGSTDRTLDIAQKFKCQLVQISKDYFSYGRSLNYGCEAATGDVLVFVSGHCVPVNGNWLENLVTKLGSNNIVYTYGAQIGGCDSKISEQQIFAKYFPAQSKLPQEGFFCNNANAALLKEIWVKNRFDEYLTGLEDMHLAKRLIAQGYRIGYVAESPVYHLHDETWLQIKRRFEREAIALQHIMPQVHIHFTDFLRYYFNAVMLDMRAARNSMVSIRQLKEIILFRFMQFWGAYRGNHIHRTLSKKQKEAYFYPK